MKFERQWHRIGRPVGILLFLVPRRPAIRPFALLVDLARLGFGFEQIGFSLRRCEAIGGRVVECLGSHLRDNCQDFFDGVRIFTLQKWIFSKCNRERLLGSSSNFRSFDVTTHKVTLD